MNILNDLFQKIAVTITSIFIVVTSTFTGQKITPQPTPTPSPIVEKIEVTPNPSITPTVTIKPQAVSVPTTAPASTSIPTPTPVFIKAPTQDSSMRIEICHAEARNEKTKYIAAENSKLDLKVAELANTRNNAETQQIALKYGDIKESDIVNGVAFYNKFRNDGFSISQAESMSMNAVNVWETYLRNLHDWALKQVNDYESRIENSATTYENNYYLKCLNE